MLKLQPEPTFTISVTVPVPGGEDQLINCVFRHKGREALKTWIDAARDRPDADSIGEIMAGWDNVEAEFSAEHLALVLDAYPGAAVAMLEAYVGELGKAAAKN